LNELEFSLNNGLISVCFSNKSKWLHILGIFWHSQYFNIWKYW